MDWGVMTEILIVDDEPDIRLLVDAILSDEGYETLGHKNSEDHRKKLVHSD